MIAAQLEHICISQPMSRKDRSNGCCKDFQAAPLSTAPACSGLVSAPLRQKNRSTARKETDLRLAFPERASTRRHRQHGSAAPPILFYSNTGAFSPTYQHTEQHIFGARAWYGGINDIEYRLVRGDLLGREALAVRRHCSKVRDDVKIQSNGPEWRRKSDWCLV